jgi:hypothetical protein
MSRVLVACLVLACAANVARAQSTDAIVVPSPPATTASPTPPLVAAPAPQQQIVIVTPSAPYVPAPVPISDAPRERTNWEVLAPGIGMLAGGWAIGWLTTIIWNLASTYCMPSGFLGLSCTVRGPYGAGYWEMAIPLVGPWLTFTTDNTFRGADIWFPVLVGLLQPAGLVMIIVGVANPNRSPASPSVRVSPSIGGLVVSGTF